MLLAIPGLIVLFYILSKHPLLFIGHPLEGLSCIIMYSLFVLFYYGWVECGMFIVIIIGYINLGLAGNAESINTHST